MFLLMSALNRDRIKLMSEICHIWEKKQRRSKLGGLQLDVVPVSVFCLKVIYVSLLQVRADSRLLCFLFTQGFFQCVVFLQHKYWCLHHYFGKTEIEGNSCVIRSRLRLMEAPRSYNSVKKNYQTLFLNLLGFSSFIAPVWKLLQNFGPLLVMNLLISVLDVFTTSLYPFDLMPTLSWILTPL